MSPRPLSTPRSPPSPLPPCVSAFLSRLCVRADAAEHCMTSGEVGRPKSELARRFPFLAAHGCLEGLAEVRTDGSFA